MGVGWLLVLDDITPVIPEKVVVHKQTNFEWYREQSGHGDRRESRYRIRVVKLAWESALTGTR